MPTRHRPRLLGYLRPYPDPTSSSDWKLQQVLAALATLPRHNPAPEFRTELRQQLVAVAPRLITEGESSPDKAAAPTAPTGATAATAAAGAMARIRRPATILLSVVAVFIVLLGGAVFLSGRALPGDSLYGVKRASENVQLSLSSSDTDRGKQYLSMARTRAGEVSDLLGHASAIADAPGPGAAAAVSAHTAKLATSTLDDQDSETRSAAQLLNDQALRTASSSPLNALLSWAPQQQARMQSIIDRIPAGSLHDRAAASLALVTAAEARSQALAPLVAAPCEATTSSDSLGPIPVPNCAAATPSGSGNTTPATGGRSTAPSGRVSTAPGIGRGSGATTGAPVTVPGLPGTGTAIPTGGLLPTQPPTSLPSVSPSLPITTGTCGVGVNLPPLVSIGVGTCGVGIKVGS
jgi:Domain of unknown function (DUF5667)